jgi:hypothetical protein
LGGYFQNIIIIISNSWEYRFLLQTFFLHTLLNYLIFLNKEHAYIYN